MTREIALPFVLVHDDGSVHVVHELPMELLKDRLTTAFTIFAREGRVHPARVIETRPTGKRILAGICLRSRSVLATKLRAAIEADDDVYDQSRSHAEHLAAIDEATSFEDLVVAIDPP